MGSCCQQQQRLQYGRAGQGATEIFRKVQCRAGQGRVSVPPREGDGEGESETGRQRESLAVDLNNTEEKQT